MLVQDLWHHHGQDPGVTAAKYVPLHSQDIHQLLRHHAHLLAMSSVQVSQGASSDNVYKLCQNMLEATLVQAHNATAPATHNGCCLCHKLPHPLLSILLCT